MSKISRYATIDISPLFGNNMEAKMKVAKEIDESCRGIGFFFISNHSIDCLDELFGKTYHVHQTMSDDEKFSKAIKAYNKNSDNEIAGYYMAIKGVKAVESIYIQNPSFDENHPFIKAKKEAHEINKWPNSKDYPGYKEFIISYYWKMFNMCKALLRGFALALGKSENYFDQYYNTNDTLSSIRLIRYPYLENYPPVKTAPDGTKLGFDTHTDVSIITLLYQPYVENLQVETPSGYVDIESDSKNFLVNCGLFMEMLTNGYYKAPLHRVKFTNAERLSLPFFVHFGFDSVIESFTPHAESNSNAGKKIKYGEFFVNGRQKLLVKNGQT